MHCYFCHGYSGNADTVASTYLNPIPRDFTTADSSLLTIDIMLAAVANGKPGTAMMGFSSKLTDAEMNAVVEFIRHNFMERQKYNTQYHTEGNGWLDFDRYATAFPFVKGARAIDDSDLEAGDRVGLQLFLGTCITCHEGRSLKLPELNLEQRAVSYPRGEYSVMHAANQTINEIDAISSATPYARHDIVPQVIGLNEEELVGERLFQDNCAFCHGADGTGKNWIGSFLEPHPRNLTDIEAMQNMTRERLHEVIANGLEGTTMSAWKSVLSTQQISAISAYVLKVFVPRAEIIH